MLSDTDIACILTIGLVISTICIFCFDGRFSMLVLILTYLIAIYGLIYRKCSQYKSAQDQILKLAQSLKLHET